MRFFLFILTSLCISGFAEIIEIETLQPLEQMIPNLSAEDYVLFDFDETLLMPNDALLHPCGKRCLAGLIKSQAPNLSASEIKHLVSLILVQRKLHLIDEKAPDLIHKLQDNNITTFCLTALRPGTYGCIDKTELWRKQELKCFGMDFKQAFPKLKHLTFKKYSKKAHPPIFIEGVFCTGSIPKGEALVYFLQKTQLKPKRVIFVDNSYYHHESVQEWMNQAGIEYIGLYYHAAKNQAQDLDENIALFQINYLIQNKRWLSDQEAATMMRRGG